MKRADEILGKAESGLPQPSWTSRTSIGDQPDQSQNTVIDQQTKALVNMIFARFMAIYGYKFKSAFETKEEILIAKREWALSLRGTEESQLVPAINYCKENLSWMPTISEFIEIIRSSMSEPGLPGLRDAYWEACMHANDPVEHEWSHPIVYWTGQQTGWFELRSEPETEIFPRFRYHYDLNLRRVHAGESLAEISHPIAVEDGSALTQATSMLDFAAANQIDEAVA